MKVLWDSGPSNVQASRKTCGFDQVGLHNRPNHVERLAPQRPRQTHASGRAFEYEALITRDRAVSQAIRDTIDRLFGGSVEGLLMSSG